MLIRLDNLASTNSFEDWQAVKVSLDIMWFRECVGCMFRAVGTFLGVGIHV